MHKWLKLNWLVEMPLQLRSALAHANSRPQRDIEHTRLILGRLILIRVIVLSLFLGANAWQLVSGAKYLPQLHSMFMLIGLTYAISLIGAVWLKKSNSLRNFSYVQLAIDLLLSTLAVYITGGALSPFILLYLLVILSGAVLFGFTGALVIAALAGLSYAMMAGQIIPPIDPTLPQATTLHILAFYVALVVLALVIGYFARELDTAWKTAISNAERANTLSYQQKQLFEEAAEGIIGLDNLFS